MSQPWLNSLGFGERVHFVGVVEFTLAVAWEGVHIFDLCFLGRHIALPVFDAHSVVSTVLILRLISPNAVSASEVQTETQTNSN